LRAARVGARPIEPVIALRTTSQVIAAISVDASAPSMTLTPGSALRIKSALATTPTTETLNFLACSMISVGLFPADVSAITLKRPGFDSTISRA